ncbi:MAG: helix-turn-helix transcriptional regulator [Peptostreptococcus sp.]|uniref:helix-turn-helix domain-containing protein n=1 Tax=Peptostreptococcus sp. TaxID=1262 RepID=UPI002FCC3429
MKIGRLLKKFRELRGLTQKKLGEKTNLDDVRIRQYELNIRSPKEDVLNNISSALDINPEYFKEAQYPYSNEDVIRLLFKMEDSIPLSISSIVIDSKRDISLNGVFFLGEDIKSFNHALEEWRDMQNKYKSEEITSEEYEIWKANWSYKDQTSNQFFDKAK